MKLQMLKTNFLGKDNIYYKEIDSTQDEIWRLIKQNKIKNGTLVMADIQTKARGTHGRIWHTDEENNIAFSFAIKLDCNIKKLDGLTVEIAKIILGIFKNRYNIELKIKEPNDIMANGKKIGGILTETKVVCENVKYLVIGIGINTSKNTFTEDIKEIATSIKKEFNVDINTEKFIEEFCNEFEKEIIKRMEN